MKVFFNIATVAVSGEAASLNVSIKNVVLCPKVMVCGVGARYVKTKTGGESWLLRRRRLTKGKP